jgi:hypothetical protein
MKLILFMCFLLRLLFYIVYNIIIIMGLTKRWFYGKIYGGLVCGGKAVLTLEHFSFMLHARFSAVIPMSIYGGRIYELKECVFASSLGASAQVACVY